MHAGIPAAVEEYLRFKDDTANFIVPGQEYLSMHARHMAEGGDYDNAILVLQTTVSQFPEFWEAYDALAETHLLRADTALAIQYYRKSLDLNPENEAAKRIITQLGGK